MTALVREASVPDDDFGDDIDARLAKRDAEERARKAWNMLVEQVIEEEQNRATWELPQDPDVLIRKIARRFGVGITQIRGVRRCGQIVIARATYCYVLHRCNYSLAQIGRMLGRDHSTIYHSVKSFSAKASPELRAWADALVAKPA